MIKSRVFLAALALACSMAGTASATPITYTFHETSAADAFYPLISANGSFTFDSSLITPDGPTLDAVTFRDASTTYLSAFDFIFVTNVSGSSVAQEFTLASVQVGAGATFFNNTNPPSYQDGTGADYVATDSLDPSKKFSLHLAGIGSVAAISILGEYNEDVYGFFTANALPTTGVPEPVTLSLFGAGLAGVAAIRRRKSKKTSAI